MVILRWFAGCFLVIALTIVGAGATNQEVRVALVIGNGGYQHVATLPNPPNDAVAISSKLAGLGFTVTTAVDVDLEAMRSAVDRFAQDSRGADIALIFYAGHGVQVAGENYLLPVDARIQKASDLSSVAMRAADLHRAFAEAAPRLAVLILDACRDNPFAGIVSSTPGLASGSVSEGLKEVRNSAGVLIAFSASPGAVAADGTDGNSPFTTALLQWIDRPGLEIGLMFRRVRETVLDLTNGTQIPWVEESLVSDIYLNPAAPAVTTNETQLAQLLLSTVERFNNPVERSAALAYYDRLLPADALSQETQVRRASLEVDQLDDQASFLQESLIWLSIRDSDDPAIYRSFLDHFPKTTFAELARMRLAQLESAAPAQPAVLVLDPADAPAQIASHADQPIEMPTTTQAEPNLAAAAPEVVTAEPPPSPEDAEAALALTDGQRSGVQRLLKQAGQYDGALDGAIGPRSRQAIAAFQAGAGQPDTGFIDRATLHILVAQAARPVLLGALAPEERAAVHQLAALDKLGSGAQPSVIRVFSVDWHQDVKTYLRNVADRFESDHPGTQVELVFQPGNDYKRDLLVNLGSDAPPDLIYTWGAGHLRALVDAGFARDLTDNMADGWAMSFKPGAVANMTIDGRVYAVPLRMSLVTLWVNRALLSKAAVDPASLGTWDGFLAAARRLKGAGITPLATGGADRWPLQFYWAALANALGGSDTFDRALSGADGGFQSPVFVNAASRFRQLAELDPFQSDFADVTNNEAIQAVAQGKAAMILTGDWALAQLSRNRKGGLLRSADQLARVPFPPPDLARTQNLTYGGIDGWAVRSGAPEATVDLLRMLSGLEVQSTIAAMGYAIPTIAGADTAIADPILRDVAFEITNSEHHQLYIDQLLGPVAGEVTNDVAVALAEGDLTPDRAAAEVETAWERVRGARPQGADAPVPAPVE